MIFPRVDLQQYITQKYQSTCDPSVFHDLSHSMQYYFQGEPVTFDKVKLDLHNSTSFQKVVWNKIRKVPWGETRSYKEIATSINTSARAVGQALAANPMPIIIPCHRVVGVNRSLRGFVYGVAFKRKLQALEKRNR